MDISNDLHRKIKLLALEKDTTMVELIREWLEQGVSAGSQSR